MPRPATWAFLRRWAFHMLFWIVLAGTDAKDMAAGAAASALASWLSLKLLAPGEISVKPARALRLFLRFLGQSVLAGVTVARIALSPAMPLRPGIIRYLTAFPEGTRRQAFTTFVSLLPGTLPSGGDGRGGLAVHCLDERQPIAAQLAEEEERLRNAFSREAHT